MDAFQTVVQYMIMRTRIVSALYKYYIPMQFINYFSGNTIMSEMETEDLPNQQHKQ